MFLKTQEMSVTDIFVHTVANPKAAFLLIIFSEQELLVWKFVGSFQP